jgi:MFS family permease
MTDGSTLRTQHSQPSLTGAAAAAAVLLLGVGLVMASTGLQGSLVGLRASLEGFPAAATGFVIASYYVGFVVGSARMPGLLRRAGHVRVFAALASLASAAVLVHVLVVNPVAWAFVRAAVGFCMAGIYIVAESWLNDLADNGTRGRIFALYMIVSMGALAGGQALLNVADPGGFHLFVLASVLVSVALVPMALTATSGPQVSTPAPLRVRDVLATAPLGIVGAVVSGVTYSALLGMGAVLGSAAGLSVAQISALVAATVLGGVAGQWPLSRASDTRDRRAVIAAASLAAAAVAVVVAAASTTWLIAGMAVFGALSMPLYSLSVAHVNDWLDRSQVVQASATLVLMVGVGSVAGPLVSSWALSAAGPAGFLGVLALAHLVLGVYALHRMTVRPRSPRQEPSRYVSFVARTATVAALVAPRRRARSPAAAGVRETD